VRICKCQCILASTPALFQLHNLVHNASPTSAAAAAAAAAVLLIALQPLWIMYANHCTALKIWVFSGDVDGIVPVLGSRRWIESLKLPLTKPWRAWYSRTGQVRV
jgi:hypothetical protein